MADSELFQEIELQRAEDVLDHLIPYRCGLLWKHRGEDNHWLFRGLSDSAWTLQPSAMRDQAMARYIPGQRDLPRAAMKVSQRCDEEMRMAMQFAASADRAGFALPGDGAGLREESVADLGVKGFPHPRYRGLFALAQHYGVPTRLLDWTPRPLVAAYFAAADAAEQLIEYKARRKFPERKSDRCAVWALSQTGLDAFTRSWEPAIKIVSAPAAQIPNLAAQMGRFTLVVYETSDNAETNDPPDLEVLFRGTKVPAGEYARFAPTLYKITFPTSEAPHLLGALASLDVTAATVYPGLKGVEQAMFERALMPSPLCRDC